MTTFTYPNSGASVALDGTVTPLLTTNQYLFLIPPQGSSTSGITDGDKDIRIQLDYDVVSIDPQLPEGYKASSNTVTASLPKEQLVEGKAYSIIFTLGVQAIKVSGNVEDWKNEEETTAPSQNAETADADGIKAAWAALNDIKATNKNGKYFVINVPTTPTADLDLSLDGTFTADKISNFETNDQVELKMLDGKSFDNTITKLPEGWFFVRRTVGTEVRYILIKTTTKVGSTVDAWNSSAWSSNMGGTNESGKNN